MWQTVRRVLVGLVSCATLGATLPRSAGAQSTVDLLGYHTAVPAAWVPRKPGSTMRLAEYVVPRANGSADSAEVVVYFFGKSQGGNVAANLARWRAQFSTPDGSPVPETVIRDSTLAFPVTFAEFRGTYARGIGAGSAPEDARTGQALLAGIAETPRGTLFIQLFGPAARVAAERDVFMKFVRGLKE
jgi:hypothetical protein